MEEGEEGVIGRLRCDVSTFRASETAKRPPAGLPTSRGSQRRGWGCGALSIGGWPVGSDPSGSAPPPLGGPASPARVWCPLPTGDSRYLPEVVGWEFPGAASEGGASLQGGVGLARAAPPLPGSPTCSLATGNEGVTVLTDSQQWVQQLGARGGRKGQRGWKTPTDAEGWPGRGQKSGCGAVAAPLRDGDSGAGCWRTLADN